MKNNFFIKIRFSIQLTLCLMMLLTLCGCGDKTKQITDKIKDKTSVILSEAGQLLNDIGNKATELYGTSKDGAIYVYSEAADITETGYKYASEKANKLIGDAKDYIKDLKKEDRTNEIKYANSDPNNPIKDLSAGSKFDETDSLVIDDKYSTEQFINYYISSVLGARGYDVYNGAVYYKGNIYSGLIFTNNDVFIEEDGKKIFSCGFVQLIDNTYTGLRITDKIVQTGLIAVPTGSYEDTKSFIVNQYAAFDSFSGIYNNYYFSYKQDGNYVLSIEVKNNSVTNYDPSLELYDFDNEKYIYSAKDAKETLAKLYIEDNDSFQGATSNVNSIVDVAENSSDEVATIITMNANALDTLLSKAKNSVDNVTNFVKKKVNNLNLTNNQFLYFDENGNAHVLGSENSVDSTRVTDGIIKTVGSGLATAGAVVSVVVTAKSGELAVTAIVITTGVSSVIYNVSNMLEGTQDIYYGTKGNDDESQNPVLNVFKKYIKDEKTAELVYNIWGIANTAITGLSITATKAIDIAKVKGLNAYETTASVIRASLTTIGKALATGIGAGIVSNYVNKVAAKISNNENIGKLAGFGSALVSGFFIYRGLDYVDQKLDISGLYPKVSVKAAFAKINEDQNLPIHRSDLTKDDRGQIRNTIKNLTDLASDQYKLEYTPKVRIVYDVKDPSMGYYDPESNTMSVNMSVKENHYINELADTIGHELYHAKEWQDVATGNYPEMYYSLNNYISPEQDYLGYINQLCEVEAYEAGKSFSNFIMNLVFN